MKTAYDASTPPESPPEVDCVCIYIGGDTPHVWTDEEIAAQKARYRLPIWVRSNPQVANPLADAQATLGWLTAHGAPPGCSVMLDLETAVAVNYVTEYADHLAEASYKTLPYGSSSTIFDNPKCDGYFIDEPGVEQADPRGVGTQYAFDGDYDLSWIDDSVTLWDTQPGTPVDPPNVTEVSNVSKEIRGSVTIDALGHGWADPGGVPGWDGSEPESVVMDETGTENTGVPEFEGYAADTKRLWFHNGQAGTYGFIVVVPG